MQRAQQHGPVDDHLRAVHQSEHQLHHLLDDEDQLKVPFAKVLPNQMCLSVEQDFEETSLHVLVSRRSGHPYQPHLDVGRELESLAALL